MIPAAKIAPSSAITAQIARFVPLPRRVFQAAVLMSLAAAPFASAQDASNWDGQTHSAARLIAGAMSKNHDAAFLRAGIEIRLDPGWQTYWRDPGDSGAPPTFDFSGSENVESVNVRWPAPERFPDGAGGNSIGYRDHVILPLHVVPMEGAKQTALRLKLEYDVCSNICIPVESNLMLNLSGDGAEDAAIARAEIRVPRQIALGQRPRTEAMGERAGQGAAAENADQHREPLAILSMHRQPGDAHDRVIVDVEAPVGAPVDLFVEGPTPDWSLPLPQQGAAEGAVRHFEFELEGLPPDAKAEGAALTLTAVSGDDAIEVTAHLD
ncbi:MAG: protein-disulfide reductase DsbD domain-containing protein [Betaproteobacteria bacterium]